MRKDLFELLDNLETDLQNTSSHSVDIENIPENISNLIHQYVSIVNDLVSLPDTKRKEAEMRLSYILADFQKKFQLIIRTGNVDDIFIEEGERALEEYWVLQSYQKISNNSLSFEEFENLDLSLFLYYLDVLHLRSTTIEDFENYIHTLYYISQYSQGDATILIDFIKRSTENVTEKYLEEYIQSYGYIGHIATGNLYVENTIRKVMHEENIDYKTAKEIVISTQQYYARIHIFLHGLVNIFQSFFNNHWEIHQHPLIHVINDLRDILDQELLIPFFIHSSRAGEFWNRLQMFENGRTIH